MRITFHHLTAAIGVVLFLLGLRRYQLPYEDGRFFDSTTGVVYLEQTAELLTLCGGVLFLAVILAVMLFPRRSVARTILP